MDDNVVHNLAYFNYAKANKLKVKASKKIKKLLGNLDDNIKASKADNSKNLGKKSDGDFDSSKFDGPKRHNAVNVESGEIIQRRNADLEKSQLIPMRQTTSTVINPILSLEWLKKLTFRIIMTSMRRRIRCIITETTELRLQIYHQRIMHSSFVLIREKLQARNRD